jgi:hypothetical protein
MTKRRSGYRKLTIGDEVWQWIAGNRAVVIYSPTDKKTVVLFTEFLGLSWDAIERYHWKNQGSDHPANVKPGAVRKWIDKHLR